MKNKKTLIIAGISVAFLGVCIYLYQRKKKVENLQKQIAQNTGSDPNGLPASKQASPQTKPLSMNWLLGD